MPAGSYVVTFDDEKKCIDINFEENNNNSIPPEQTILKDEVQDTQTVLQEIYKKDKDTARFSEYHQRLFSIAKGGLTGLDPKTELARRDLVSFQDDVTTREAGRVKHRHLKRLGKYAAGLGVSCFLVASVLYVLDKNGRLRNLGGTIELIRVINFLYLWSGCMTGVWLSFGIRKPTLQFFELHNPEPDLLHPLMRLLFAGLLTVIISLLLVSGAMSVEIGRFSTKGIYDDGVAAWLVGALCGVSEQLLSQQVTKQAARFFRVETNSPRRPA